MRTRLVRCFVTVSLLAAASACGNNGDSMGPGSSGGTTGDAIQALEDALYTAINIPNFRVDSLDAFSFAEANTLFKQALDADPADDIAAFGTAVTTIFMLEDDPQLRAAAEEWEAYLDDPDPQPFPSALLGVPTPLTWRRATLPVDLSGANLQGIAEMPGALAELVTSPSLVPPPSISTHLGLLRSVVAPAVDDALDALGLITDPSFAFTITERMQGEDAANADPLELDYTEVLALQAALEVAEATIYVATAYQLTPNPLSVQGFVDALTPGSGFLEITSSGATDLGTALSRIESAVDDLLDALDNLEAETDDQSDDIIKYDASGLGGDPFDGGLNSSDVDDARSVLTDVQGALAGPTSVTINEGDPDEFTFDVNAREFFLTPITDFKALLPPYTVGTAMEESEEIAVLRWTDLNVADWDFPDPTFSGILPNITQQQAKYDLGLGGLFFEFSVAEGYYQLISADGVDCYDDLVAGSGLGCDIGGTYYYGGALDVSDNAAMPEAWLNLYATSSGSLYDSGPYTVTDAGDADPTTYTITVDLTGLGTVVGDLTDMPGYTNTDQYGRARGGSTIAVSYSGSTLLFERQ